MAKHVLRYPFTDLPMMDQVINMPAGALVIHWGYQAARPEWSLWVEADPSQSNEARRFRMLATGEKVPEGWWHVGTTIMPDGFHTFHLYEAPEAG